MDLRTGPKINQSASSGPSSINPGWWAAGDLEDVAEWITHHRSAIPMRRIERLLDGLSSRLNCATVRLVGVVDVDTEEYGKWFAFDDWSNHHERVADRDLGRATRWNLAHGVED
jgi:hypothetical protein